eukprot:GHUV01004533.1.p1 GENE.GHUV01004533.1~~GHUV01004533.1.p1  ORF type:complete len:168 (+),score=64.08 GHUV01004533.1:259-762(+)
MQRVLTPCLRLGFNFIPPRRTYPTSVAIGLDATASRWVGSSSSNRGNVPVCPTEPGSEDCCQSGCENCVWDVYREELKQYTDYMAQHHPEKPIPGAKAVKQQMVDASLDAFEQLERQLQQKQQEQQQKAEQQPPQQHKQQQHDQQQQGTGDDAGPYKGLLRVGNYVF